MKTRLLSLLMAIVMLSTVFTVVAAAESLSEVPDGYVGVYTTEDLFAVRENPSGKYILMNDIVFDDADYVSGGSFYNSGKGWEPIGTSSTPFTGTFDGNGYEIVNLKINNPDTSYQGLFGYANSATIQNVNLTDAYITGGNYTGGIVGYLYTYATKATLSNCSCNGYIAGKLYVGGIAGFQDPSGTRSNKAYSYIIDCLNSAEITGEKYVGGITGFSTSNYYSSSYGSNYDYSYIQKSVNSGTIICSGSYAGGISGYASSSSNSSSGSIAPLYIQNCCNTGNIYANDYAGGILGGTSKYGYTEYCYSIGEVNANSNYGACFGETPYKITFCYYLEDTVTQPDCIAGTAKSADQLEKQGTFEQWDFDTVWTMEGREDFLYPELRDVTLVFPDDSKTAISGTVTVTGEAKVGSTLTAEVTDVSPADAAFEYEWRADGKLVGTDATYTVTQDDVGKNITLTVKGSGDFKGSFSSSALVGECVHHVEEYTSNNDATCSKNATKYGVCDKCNSVVTVEIEGTKLSHTFKNYVYDNNATCAADGTMTAKCENCDATDVIDAENTKLDHTFSDDWTIDKDPTCTQEGIKSHHCKNCSAKKDETVINKLAHIYVADVTESTCYNDGKIVYTCSCGDTYSKTLYATGHIDNDGDGRCDECSEKIHGACNCICHKSSPFIKFIWKFLSFFNRLFGTNATCACGEAHW